ncbi:Cell wall protein [Sparassis crispa]|uniref:glucan endo-1,3-beta-D-glucosidase n=1 Tax=Sparassis crispa TaxID=139825 RepID=A0A401GFD8_9APHY|nr:Cell wall protein [Sparassis crispa]GBE80841.1 Cell wall protein [Sparassis crispa]
MFTLSLVAASLFLGATAQVTPSNIVPSSSGSLAAIKYTNVGGSGTYSQVTDMIPGTFPSCTINPSCITQEVSVSGNLAPFDDELTMVYRGPANIYNIAVYQPTSNSSSSTWAQTSSWTAGQPPTNLVFMANMGGGASGNWSICGGSSQAYANGAWNAAVATPNEEVASGYLDETHQINIMTATTCEESPCTGYSWGTANHGWKGSKMFVFTLDMPASDNAADVPAVWVLNAQVVRAAQYGCNCRGMGGNGGCGELDILEVLSGSSPNQAISELYSFMGATGSGGESFARPSSASTYTAIFDIDTDSIAIQQLTEWDYSTPSITRSLIEGYLAAPKTLASVSGNSRRSARNLMGAHRRRHEH